MVDGLHADSSVPEVGHAAQVVSGDVLVEGGIVHLAAVVEVDLHVLSLYEVGRGATGRVNHCGGLVAWPR